MPKIVRRVSISDNADFIDVAEKIVARGCDVLAIVYNEGDSCHIEEPNLSAEACEQIAECFTAIAKKKRDKKAH